MMKLVRISVETSVEAEDAVSYIFMEMGSGGVQLEDIKSASGKVIVSAYFPLDDMVGERVFKLRSSLDKMQEFITSAGKAKISLENLDDVNWSEGWKSFFKPLLVGKRIVVYPSWEDITHLLDRDIYIQIDPGMAFGTGKHATTILSLELLEKAIKGGEEVADIGTGSGILAIASVKLGASSVLAVDIDSESVGIAKENSRINGVDDRIKVLCGDLITAVNNRYDVLVSNIHTKILLNMIPHVKDYLKQCSYIILSGILDSEAYEIENELKKENFVILETPQHDEWVAFLAKVRHC
jgi:ribosomal protein L11 methyltransferase